MEAPAHATSFDNVGASSRRRTIAHWIATTVIGAEGVIGGILALVLWPPYVGVITHLGYPAYLMTIIGFWYAAAAAGLVILVPRLPRAEERAYAFFLVASWALRPAPRRLIGPAL